MLFDSLRGKVLASRPEEAVRQNLLKVMIEDLGYPKHLVAVEKSIKELVKQSGGSLMPLPDRRIDVVCFSKGTIAPLLLIECKASKLSEKALQQLLNYNHYIKAKFVCLTNFTTSITGYSDKEGFRLEERLFSYPELMEIYGCIDNSRK